jgi:hypothetical protein
MENKLDIKSIRGSGGGLQRDDVIGAGGLPLAVVHEHAMPGLSIWTAWICALPVRVWRNRERSSGLRARSSAVARLCLVLQWPIRRSKFCRAGSVWFCLTAIGALTRYAGSAATLRGCGRGGARRPGAESKPSLVAIEEALLVREPVQGAVAARGRPTQRARRQKGLRRWPRASCANGLTITEGWPPHPRTQAIAESASVV